MRRLQRACVWLCACVPLAALPAAAQPAGIGADYVHRPLVLPSGVMRFDGGPRWPDYDALLKHALGTDFFVLNPGLAVGLGSHLEVGGVIPLTLSPQAQVENPRLYGLYSLAEGESSYGIFAQLEPRLRNDGLAVLTLGVPWLVRLSEDARFDVGAFLDFYLGDNGSALSVHIPAYLPIQLTPQVYAGPELGISFFQVLDETSGFAIPVGGFVGYTVARTADISGRVRLKDITDGAGAGAFDLMLGVELYFGGN